MKNVQNHRVGSLSYPDVRGVPVFIYGLAEPDTMTVRYVGKSAAPRLRFTAHVSRPTARMTPWIKGLAANGQRPRLLVLLRIEPGEDCAEHERACIAAYSKLGELLNVRGLEGAS